MTMLSLMLAMEFGVLTETSLRTKPMKMLLIDYIDDLGCKQSVLDSLDALGCPGKPVNVRIVDTPIEKIRFT